jgi:hypothetical protein
MHCSAGLAVSALGDRYNSCRNSVSLCLSSSLILQYIISNFLCKLSRGATLRSSSSSNPRALRRDPPKPAPHSLISNISSSLESFVCIFRSKCLTEHSYVMLSKWVKSKSCIQRKEWNIIHWKGRDMFIRVHDLIRDGLSYVPLANMEVCSVTRTT